MRVVADTNILISALMFGGLPGSFLDLALMNGFELVTSPTLLDELSERLGTKFRVSYEDLATIRSKLESVAVLVSPADVFSFIENDPDDNRVLECAVEGRANVIVSGDRHLLRLERFQNIPVMRVRDFLNGFPWEAPPFTGS